MNPGEEADRLLGDPKTWRSKGIIHPGRQRYIEDREAVPLDVAIAPSKSFKPDDANQIDRFRKFVPDIEQVGTDGCWVWQGAYNGNGSPVFWDSNVGRTVAAARWAYDFIVEPVPAAFRVERACGNALCVAPFHGKVVRLSNK